MGYLTVYVNGNGVWLPTVVAVDHHQLKPVVAVKRSTELVTLGVYPLG